MKKAIMFVCALFLVGCAPHTPSEKPEKFTLGNVQRKIEKGMTQAEVAESLGSPNIVTRDAHGKEAWVYDKMARDVTRAQNEVGVWFIVGAYRSQNSASTSTQRTLTVVIKFDDKGQVDDVTYHSSQF